jgi:hypothetical protein
VSKSTQPQETGEGGVRRRLAEDFAPWEKSRQAKYHEYNGRRPFSQLQNHDDGEAMYQQFGMTPFYKVLERAERRDHPVYRFPAAYLNALLHVDDAEIWALEDGELAIVEDAPRTRRKVMEWVVDHPEVIDVLEDGGREWHAHAKPGKGKTSFANVVGTVRNAEINNDTVLWMLTLEELECLAVAPWMTILKPEGVAVEVEARPKDYRLPDRVSIDLTDVFRDVVEYTDPVDLFEKVVPGGIYGVLPDPRFRECEKLVRAAYNSAWEAEEHVEVTPLRDYIHAVLEVRARHDVFLHQTTMIVDEFGDLCPKNPEADESDLHAKVKEYPKRVGKARKKGLSIFHMSHSLKRIHEDVLEKERWFLTLPETPAPKSGLSGLGECPLPRSDYTSNFSKGEATSWNATNYADITWQNPYRRYDFRGEIHISYPEMEEALHAL